MENALARKKVIHHQFWQGKGPCLIFTTTPELSNLDPASETLDKYDTSGYRDRFYSPVKMWEAEMRRAAEVVNWPTDGIPTVRSNLGTVFIPAMAGQEFIIQEAQMPHIGSTLSLAEIQNIKTENIFASELMTLATDFYTVHSQSAKDNIAAYFPDTQGIFDLAHLMYGDKIFFEMIMEKENI